MKQPTRGLRVIDIIMSNLGKFYDEPIIVPAIIPDRANKGVPSDHCGVVATPHTNPSMPKQRTKITKTIQPLPESLISVFGDKLSQLNWSNIDKAQSPTDMVQLLQNSTSELLQTVFPKKTVHIYPDDKPWFNERLRKLKRERQRLYRKGGRNEKYLKCKQKFGDMQDVEISKYKEKILKEVTEGKRGSSYAGLRKLGSQPGESMQTGFQLPEYVEKNLSNAECAEKLAYCSLLLVKRINH